MWINLFNNLWWFMYIGGGTASWSCYRFRSDCVSVSDCVSDCVSVCTASCVWKELNITFDGRMVKVKVTMTDFIILLIKRCCC